MTKAFLTSIFILSVLFAFGQNHQDEFYKAFKAGDTEKQLEALEAWEKDSPDDAELFTSYFNYYFFKSKEEIVELTTEEPEGEGMVLEDEDGQVAGYLGSSVYYKADDVKNAFTKIDEGIKKHPDRLDMRFGKVYALGEIKDWERFTQEIVNAIQRSSENDNKWLWTNNEARDDGKELFLTSLQDYQIRLYNTGENKLLENMRVIAQEVLKYYPNHIESLSNVSITYILAEEYDKALDFLLKAEENNPKDDIILSNIAHVYKTIGDRKKAIKYYEKIVKNGNENFKGHAEKEIEALKNQ